MKAVAQLPHIIITPHTMNELNFYEEMLSKMKARFVVSKPNESLLSRLEEGLKEAKEMKEGKLPKKPLCELYEYN